MWRCIFTLYLAKGALELYANRVVEDSEEEEEPQEEESIRADESNQEYFFQSSDENSVRAAAMKKEMEEVFSVGSEFLDIDELRIRAQELGRKYNCPITTDKSYQKLQTITLICQHGKTYRKSRKSIDPSLSQEDVSVKKTKKRESKKSGCPCIIQARLCPIKKKVTVRKVNGSHNHHVASDARTYTVHRKTTADIFEEALAMLQYNTPTKVLEVVFDITSEVL